MAEFELIQRYFAGLTPPAGTVRLGIGDDAALLEPPPGHTLVMTLDTLVAGRHFFSDADPEGVGHKSLAVNLSDLAAMGAEPAWALLSLTLPQMDPPWLAAFSRGLGALAHRHGVSLVGGDSCRGPLSIALQLTGLVPAGRALTRGGGRPGDRVFVTGTLGDAALALRLLQAGRSPSPALRRRLERPEPRLAEGQRLRGIASACIDLSDGLVADLGHLCRASGCGARLQAEAIPRSAAVRAAGDWRLPLAGGDDYELCFTVPPANLARLQALDLELHPIGELVEGEGVEVLDSQGRPLPHYCGFDHFS